MENRTEKTYYFLQIFRTGGGVGNEHISTYSFVKG